VSFDASNPTGDDMYNMMYSKMFGGGGADIPEDDAIPVGITNPELEVVSNDIEKEFEKYMESDEKASEKDEEEEGQEGDDDDDEGGGYKTRYQRKREVLDKKYRHIERKRVIC
jgi:hypothetical protein